MLNTLIVGLGGFLGAIARYGLSGLIQKYAGPGFPLGTMMVNISGCLAIGGVLYLVEDRSVLGPNARLFLAIGILGGFTTFSSFGYETLQLLKDRESFFAFLNIAGNVVLGLGAVWAGRAILKAVGA